MGPASHFLEPPPVNFVRPVSVLPRFLHHSRNRSQFVGPPSHFLESPVDFVWPVSVFLPGFLNYSRSCS